MLQSLSYEIERLLSLRDLVDIRLNGNEKQVSGMEVSPVMRCSLVCNACKRVSEWIDKALELLPEIVFRYSLFRSCPK